MKVIKPYGRSIVKNSERKINHSAERDIKSIEDFMRDDKDFFIAQWISMLDKIITKPHSSERVNSITYRARENLSKAFIKLWNKENLVEYNNGFKKKWQAKVHSYKKPNKLPPKEDKKLIKKGRWYKTFAGDVAPDTCNWNELAKKVYQHLYHKQKSISKDKEHSSGLIAKRAKSISSNARKFRFENSVLGSLSANEQRHISTLKVDIKQKDWQEIKERYQLALLVDNLKEIIINHKKNSTSSKPKQHLSSAIMACLYQHYGEIFGRETKIIEIQNKKLWFYHCMVKEALYQRYSKQALAKKVNLPEITEDILHKLALAIEKNRMLSFAIRLGKVIHYDESAHVDGFIDLKKIVNNDYWTSKKQTEIKQKESFIKQWLGALSVANYTLRNLVNYHENKKDILLEINLKIKDENVSHFDNQFKLLFGNNHNLYSNSSNSSDRNVMLVCLQKTLSNIRNASFHFNTAQGFKTVLTESIDQNKCKKLQTPVEAYIKNKLKEQQRLLIESLKAAHIEKYLSQEQVNIFLEEIQQTKIHALLLPKFNKLLTRAANIKKIIVKPVNQSLLQEDNTLLCQFVCLKQLYESGFDSWLHKKEKDALNKFLKEAKDTATQSAKTINRGDQEIKAKMEKLRNLEEETLLQYFSYLASETASFFQVQTNTYSSNKKSAKNQSNFIENFKQDFLALAFKQYLKDKDLCFLVELVGNNEKHGTCNIPDNLAVKAETIAMPWIYMVLHLIPAEFVNHIFLQIKKYHILTGEREFSDIARAIDLYLSVHNTALDITSLRGSKLKCFYKNEQDFKNLFEQNDEQLIPVRGLRELLRFGNLIQLKTIFYNLKITSEEINEFNEIKPEISALQNKRTSIHKELSNKPNKLSHSKKEDYKAILRKITKYKHLKNHIYLHHHKQTHQLIMTILGRFVGFSHMWERDIYFTVLSLLALRGLTIEYKKFRRSMKNGQIIKVLHKILRKMKNKGIYNNLDDLFFISKNTDKRNDFAHFNSLRKKGTINLTQLLNDARKLMHYDRKLKNSVAKSVVTLLEKDNLSIKFDMKEYELSCKNIEAKEIEHFKNKEIKERLQAKKYVDAIAKLFNMCDT